MARTITFDISAFEDFTAWSREDKKIHSKITTLLKDIVRSPFSGLGKPEPLKHQFKGYWSRRITDEHRLVYKVTDETIVVVACKFHYGK